MKLDYIAHEKLCDGMLLKELERETKFTHLYSYNYFLASPLAPVVAFSLRL